jgi:protein-S-isoprenylcysteine O-methyltransferase Ste14
MTAAGWWIMILSVGGVFLVFCWCIWMVFRTSQEEKRLHGFEKTTPDIAEDRKHR